MSAGGGPTTDLVRLSERDRRSAREIVESLGLHEGVAGAGADGRATVRPRVVAVMIASADGRAAVQGRSVALGHPADRALLRELRAGADAILVGSRTLAAERYANLLDPEQRARRAAAGLPAHPIVATVSRRFDLPGDVPILQEDGTPIRVFTEAEPSGVRSAAAALEVRRIAPMSLAAVLDSLAAEGVRGITCEGGPALLRQLVAAGLVDDLLLTVAPMLVAGDAPTVLAGPELGEPARLVLREVHRAEDHLFLHYRQRA